MERELNARPHLHNPRSCSLLGFRSVSMCRNSFFGLMLRVSVLICDSTSMESLFLDSFEFNSQRRFQLAFLLNQLRVPNALRPAQCTASCSVTYRESTFSVVGSSATSSLFSTWAICSAAFLCAGSSLKSAKHPRCIFLLFPSPSPLLPICGTVVIDHGDSTPGLRGSYQRCNPVFVVAAIRCATQNHTAKLVNTKPAYWGLNRLNTSFSSAHFDERGSRLSFPILVLVQ